MQAPWNWETFRQERRFQFPPIGAGTDIFTYQFYTSVPMQRRHHQGGSINQRLIKLKQGQKTAFPFPLMVSPCLEKGKHSSLPYTPIPIRFLSPNILLAAVTEPRSSICTRFYSHVYGFCFTPFFYLWFLCQSESNFINVFFHRRASHLRFDFKIVSNIIA